MTATNFTGKVVSSCSEQMLTCNDGKCIEKFKKCNGFPDCSAGEDEKKQMCGKIITKMHLVYQCKAHLAPIKNNVL